MIKGFSKTYYDNKCCELNNRDNAVVDEIPVLLENTEISLGMFYQSRPLALYNRIKKCIS